MGNSKISTGSYDLNKWLYGGYEEDVITMSHDFRRCASGPSPLRMETIEIAGHMYYCLRCRDANFDDTWEYRLLPDLDYYFSEGWSAADFALMWGRVQKALGSLDLGFKTDSRPWSESDGWSADYAWSDSIQFTFHVDTKDGRLVKDDAYMFDAVACGQANVRLKTMEKGEGWRISRERTPASTSD